MSSEKNQVEKVEKTTSPHGDKKIDAELFSQCFSESLGHDLSFYKSEPLAELTTESASKANSDLTLSTTENTCEKSDLKNEVSSFVPNSQEDDSVKVSESIKSEEEEQNSTSMDTNGETEITPEIPKLRIIFAGMDGRFSTTALQVLAGAHKIVGIIHSQPRRTGKGFLESWLRAGKGAGNLEKFAKYYGCPFFSTKREYNHDLLRFIKHLKPDLICISNFSIILPPDIFEIPQYGTINLHLSSLPTYRGPNPWLWMFYDGCTENEYVIHKVDEGEDTGPIFAKNSYNIPPNVTCSELADCVLPNAACLMLRVVDDIALGKAQAQPQPKVENLRRARYVKPGEALIDWKEWGAERVASFLMGASVWYEPFSIFPCLIRIYEPAVLGDSRGKPGTNHWRLWYGWISCKDGIVPYRVYIRRYEFWRLFIPLLILLLLAVMF